MEKVQSICLMRDLWVGLRQLEEQLTAQTDIDLKEAMTLCAIAHECKASTDIARCAGLRPAHTSKVLSALEQKGLLTRIMGSEDRRKMFFELSEKGEQCLDKLRHLRLDVPEVLRPLMAE